MIKGVFMDFNEEKEAIWPGSEGMIPSLPRNAANASWHTTTSYDTA